MELVVRFLIGGAVVSLFAILADGLKPKSFAGLVGAAPSIALATISLTVLKNGRSYADTEARSMIIGAIAFLAYACLVSRILLRYRSSVVLTTSLSLSVWVSSALGLWYLTSA